ncbi:MAG: cation:proton antiporter [Candidatus Omnitrophota bacterium]|nr:cation:proton antiporter [Candidatus Omnitrophota bacterium]MDZ4241878.1 cation:proton antiporter [Candidatus Omnitrophota bacterium]
MFLIFAYSALLLAGIVISQTADLSAVHVLLEIATTFCLAYIMLEVGLEFTINKSRWKSYISDFGIAMTAAVFPWVLCAVYLLGVLQLSAKEAVLVGLAAAPTSAGVLFAMLSAVGLGATWLFQKARILAIFDDLGTILLIIPLQILLVGFKPELVVVVILSVGLLAAAYRWLNCVPGPTSQPWMLVYSGILVTMLIWLEHTTHIHLEILIPSFALGCLLQSPHMAKLYPLHEETHLEPDRGGARVLDRGIKGAFMLLVGCSLPKIELGEMSWGVVAVHVLLLTVLSNLGKCFPIFCYRNEVPLRQRLALSIAMFPRGEVGAGVLLIALSYGFGGWAASLAALSLALNLLLTGVFIYIVIRLIAPAKT